MKIFGERIISIFKVFLNEASNIHFKKLTKVVEKPLTYQTTSLVIS